MFVVPDYSKYTRKQLEQVLVTVDAERFPDRVKAIEEAIENYPGSEGHLKELEVADDGFTSVLVRRLKFSTVVKVMTIGSVFFFVPFSIVMGIFSFFGASTVTWNGEHLTGFSGLLASPLIGVFLALVFGLMEGVFVGLGLLLYSKVRPVSIKFRPEQS